MHSVSLSNADLQALCWSLEILSQLANGHTDTLIVASLAGLTNPNLPPSPDSLHTPALLLQALRQTLLNIPHADQAPPSLHPHAIHAQTLLQQLQPLLQQENTPPTPHLNLPPNYFISQRNSTFILHYANPSTRKLSKLTKSSLLQYILDFAHAHALDNNTPSTTQ